MQQQQMAQRRGGGGGVALERMPHADFISRDMKYSAVFPALPGEACLPLPGRHW
jgi:hypothetical protein